MNKILFSAFLFLGCLSTVAQKKVCQSDEHLINDFNSVNKCIIEQKEDVKKKVYSVGKFVLIKRKSRNKTEAYVNNKAVLNKKISNDLVKKVLIIDEMDAGVLNNTTFDR